VEFDGLCNSDHFDRYGLKDHWKGEFTRSTSKGKVLVSWNHVSPSQIENFVKCKRAWFFKSIQKVPEKQKGHQSLGEAFHLVLEKVPQGLSYPSRADVDASSEDWDKADAMAKQALPLLPVSDKIVREHAIRLDTYPNGPTMVGYIDIAIPTGVGWPAFIIPANEAIVGDYKTLSDFRYMKTPQELADSVQMMTYAKWAIEAHQETQDLADIKDGPPNIRLVHMYAKTRAPFTRSSIRHESALVTPNEINTKWNKTLDIVREMEQVSSCTQANDVEANGALNGHCEAYGGCQFRDKCGISPSSGIKTLFQITKKPQEQDLMGSAILDKIRAAQAKAASATPSTPVTVAPSATISATPGVGEASASVQGIQSESLTPATSLATGVTSPAKGPVSGLLAKIQSTGKGRPHLAGAICQAYGKEQGQPLVTLLGDGDLRNTTISTLGELIKLASGVVPPDAPARTQEVITRPGEAVVDPEAEIEEGEDSETSVDEGATVPVKGSEAGETTPEGDFSGSDANSVDPVSTSVKKRGRPSREEMAAREALQKKAFDDAVNAEVLKRMGNNTNAHEALNDQSKDINALSAQLNQQQELINALRQERDTARAVAKGIPVQDGLTLYVDCFPVKGDQPVDFFEWIGPICAQVAQQNDVGDWRQINYTAKALLANAIRATVKEHGAPKAIAVSSYAGGADVALEILTPIAKRVIKKL
jgi:hypothetical protein